MNRKESHLAPIDEINAEQLSEMLESHYEWIVDERKPANIIEQIRVLEEQLKENKGLVIPRSIFSDSKSGEAAYKLIMNGARCDRWMSRLTSRKCSNNAIMTIEFDHSGDMIQLPVCSLDDYVRVEAWVDEDFKKEGRYTVFGMNGFGRF